ncbi:MAG: hypothetical protein JW900_03310 [Anaerolineae bacterium]|nr:hypothetical protein [Anaerolineae bacterium]
MSIRVNSWQKIANNTQSEHYLKMERAEYPGPHIVVSISATTEGETKFHTLTIADQRGILQEQQVVIPLHRISDLYIRRWTVSPDNQYLAVDFSVSILGHDLDQGICFELETGKKLFHYDEALGEITFDAAQQKMIVPTKDGPKTYLLPGGQEPYRVGDIPKVESEAVMRWKRQPRSTSRQGCWPFRRKK